jgi:hypothetical protein
MFTHPQLRKVICNSKMVRDDIARRFALPDDKLTVIYNGVDTVQFSPEVRAFRSAMRWVFPAMHRCWRMSGQALAVKASPPRCAPLWRILTSGCWLPGAINMREV